jgi:hypothetical protein
MGKGARARSNKRLRERGRWLFEVMGIKYYIVYPMRIEISGDVSKMGKLIIRPFSENENGRLEFGQSVGSFRNSH